MDMNRSNRIQKQDKRKKPSLLYPIFGLILAGALFCYAWRISNKDRIVPQYDQPKSTSLYDFYKTKIIPLINEASIRDKNAAENALFLLHDEMEIYRNGIDPFVDDITSWGTEYGLFKHYSADLWDKYWKNEKNVESVNKYVHEKFEKHIISGIKLNKTIERVINQFVSDIKASRNILYSEVKLAIKDYSLGTSFQQPNFGNFFAEIDSKTTAMAKKMSGDSIAMDLAIFAGSSVAGDATSKLIEAILARIASSFAMTEITVGTPTLVAYSATGGSVGTVLGGPAGTIIGVGAGLAVGCIVDWWMTKRFKAKLIKQCSDYLTLLETYIINGSDNAKGLKFVFKEANQALDQAYIKSFADALTEDTL